MEPLSRKLRSFLILLGCFSFLSVRIVLVLGTSRATLLTIGWRYFVLFCGVGVMILAVAPEGLKLVG